MKTFNEYEHQLQTKVLADNEGCKTILPENNLKDIDGVELVKADLIVLDIKAQSLLS